MNTIIAKVRDILNDGYKYNEDPFQYTGLSSIFRLTESNIDATSLKAYLNGTLWAGSNYSYDAITGLVTVTGAMISGDAIKFGYNAYNRYSQTELKSYIRSALYYLSIEQYRTFSAKSDDTIFPTPTEAEANLIALITSIVISGSLRSYRTTEISIDFNEKLTKEEKIHHAIVQFSKTFGVLKFVKLDKDVTIPKEDEDTF